METIKIHNHPIAANTYIVLNEGINKGVIIDPSFKIADALNDILNEGICLTAILLTHGHFDHIAGVNAVRKALNIPVYVHKDDADMLFSSEKNHGSAYGLDISTDPAENIVEDGQIITEAGMEFKVLHTPGHTKGSVCYLCGDSMYSGDTLFHMSIGRTDLPGGDYDAMVKSLKRLSEIQEDYKVYPGHEQSTSLSYEKNNNIYFSL